MTGVILETSLFTREGNMTGVYLMKFRDCRTVATAVAARELDIKDVKHVVNQKMTTEMDGVKIKVWLNWSCGEPKSCYFNRFTMLPSGLFLQLDGVKIKDRSNWSCEELKSCHFLQLDGVKIKDQSNWSCEELKSCYFNPTFSSAGWSKDQGLVELVVWKTKVGLLQPEGRGFFLVQIIQEPSFFMPHLLRTKTD